MSFTRCLSSLIANKSACKSRRSKKSSFVETTTAASHENSEVADTIFNDAFIEEETLHLDHKSSLNKLEASILPKSSSHTTLPSEVKSIILEYMFSGEELEDLNGRDQERLKSLPRRTLQKMVYRNGACFSVPITIRTLPRFEQLFVSQAFLNEALPIYAKHTILYVEEVLLKRESDPKNAKFSGHCQKALQYLLDNATQVAFHADYLRCWSVDASTRIAPHMPLLSQIHVLETPKLGWVENPTGAKFAFVPGFVRVNELRLLTTDEVTEIVTSPELPKNLRRQIIYYMYTSAQDPWNFSSIGMKTLVLSLPFLSMNEVLYKFEKISQLTGTQHYHLKLFCRVESLGDVGDSHKERGRKIHRLAHFKVVVDIASCTIVR